MILPGPELLERMSAIRILLSDVDGILTNGRLIYGSGQIETKEFHVRDGMAVKLWRNCGYPFGLITARESEGVKRRAEELAVDYIVQKEPKKLYAIEKIISDLKLSLDQVCYIGDDLHDLAAIQAVGLGATVADAAAEVLAAADIHTKSVGGAGAIRELVETLLKTQNKWDAAVRPFYQT